MDPFNQRQSGINRLDENEGDNSITAPLPAAVPEHLKPTIPQQMDQSLGATGQMHRNHAATRQDYQLPPQSKIEGAAYQYQMPSHTEGQISTHPAMSGGSFHLQVPHGGLHPPLAAQVPKFSSVIQPNPTCYLPTPNMFFPKQDQDYFHPHHGMFPMEQSGFISPAQLPFPPSHPFMPGLMPEYHLPQVKSEQCQGSSSRPHSFASETGRDQNFNKNFGAGAKRNLNESNNNVRDESEFYTNFQGKQSKQMVTNSFEKIASVVGKTEEHQSPIVKIQDDGSNKRFKAGTPLYPKDRDMKTENNFIHSVTNPTEVNSMPPKLSTPRAKRQTKTSCCPKPRSTLTLPKRKPSPTDLSTAPPFKLTSPTPISTEQLEATRMKMVFSPKLRADTPCPGCIEHKSHVTVQCESSPVNQPKDELSFGEATTGSLGEANVTLDGVLCQMCGEVLGLDANEIHNVSYLTGESNSEESVFDEGPLGNIKCAQTSLAVNVKKAVKEIITISDDDDDNDDDIKIPIGQSRRTMQFKGKQKQGSDGSRNGTIKKAITKPFACNVCSKTYIREHALKAHVKIQHGHSSMKVKVESVPDENKNTQINAKLVSQNAENHSPGPVIKKSSIPDSFAEKGSIITDLTIEKSSIPDHEINELLISSDDEASPPIFISKQRSTTKKQEAMENSNTLFENEENLLENEEDSPEAEGNSTENEEAEGNSSENEEAEENSTENEEDMSQELTGKISSSVVCPQIMKESARNEMVARRQLSRSCWYCLADVSPGPWQVHRYEPNKYLCSKCFDMHKANAEKKEQQEKLDKNDE